MATLEKHVMLRRDREIPFRRAIRHKVKAPVPGPGRLGAVRKTLVFPPGEILTLRGTELAEIEGDIGPALEEMIYDEERKKYRPARPLFDHDPTDSQPETEPESTSGPSPDPDTEATDEQDPEG